MQKLVAQTAQEIIIFIFESREPPIDFFHLSTKICFQVQVITLVEGYTNYVEKQLEYATDPFAPNLASLLHCIFYP